jgi:predicted HTH domain antitoxin
MPYFCLVNYALMILDVPNEFISITAYTEHDFKVDVAVMLYQRKVVTLARAARWLGMNRLQFQKILADRNVPLNFSLEDLDIDLKTIQSMPS